MRFSFPSAITSRSIPSATPAALPTSGNSANCVAAAEVMRAIGGRSIALTGQAASRLSDVCDIAIRVPETETFRVQELHLPVYHALCAMLEEELF